MAKKPINVTNAILCEYVAQGSFNKHTLVNVFSGDVVAREFPVEIPFGIFLILDEVNIRLLKLELLVNGESVFVGEADGPFRGTGPLAIASFKVKVKEPNSVMELVLSSADHKNTIAISKKVLQGEITYAAPPTASKPPS
ncbi:hypothetical protein NKH47_27195 [Mesorhizobium sp. M1060]|uniref:hypothetical protein n=1 Tax=unclassified Mesorhizobium TaxID=325217 RepID=UPI00047C3727|nr:MULTISPECIES: hypothetical protein [unclassified Mesorhizobium]WJI51789.1 hypothetical protein NLY44_03480 [Mesorhizobium sp. C089B]WJI68774.1 hypothetical protein NLY36_29025 [Mesorhizobium sp. C399B]